MNQLWSESNAEGVKKQIKALLSAPYRCADGTLSPTEAWLRAAEIAWSYKLMIAPPPTTATDRVRSLREAGAWQELNDAYRLEGLNFEADREARALLRWTGIMQQWGATETKDK
jgi:hypothetical protein